MRRTLARPGTRLAHAQRCVLRRLSVPVCATAILASLALPASPAQAASCAGADLLPAIASVPTAKAATLCLLNAERAARGLAPLSTEPKLEAAATAYSHAMVQQRFFAHVSPGGQAITDRLASYIGSASSWITGENLAWGEGALATPSATVRGWMASPTHRDNILKGAFDEIGIGIVGGTPRGGLPAVSATYTTHFGARTLESSKLVAGAASTKKSSKKTSTRISAKKKKQISRRCHSVARRTKASTKTRRARYDRCMRTELRAAKTRQAASTKCHRVARRTKASKKTRKARYDRCMRSELRAAKKRQ